MVPLDGPVGINLVRAGNLRNTHSAPRSDTTSILFSVYSKYHLERINGVFVLPGEDFVLWAHGHTCAPQSDGGVERHLQLGILHQSCIDSFLPIPLSLRFQLKRNRT